MARDGGEASMAKAKSEPVKRGYFGTDGIRGGPTPRR